MSKRRRPLKQFRKKLPLAGAAALLIRLLGRTMRYELDDRSGISRGVEHGSLIWLFWHNRVLLTPYLHKRYWPNRKGAVLTSPSNDGEVIAGVMARFGVDAVRGSSNKRAAASLRELLTWLRSGKDIVITPDGPRGPRYELKPGAVKLAQLARVPLMPVHVNAQHAWRLKTWDGFVIPRPFSKVSVIIGPAIEVARTSDDSAFEKERLRIQETLLSSTIDQGRVLPN